VSVQSGSRYLAIGLAGAAICLSLIGRSRGWLHTTGSLHVWYHVVLFAVLGVLSMTVSNSPSKRAEWMVWMVVVGFAIESSQAIINHTTMEWADVWSDGCCIVLGGVVGWVISLRQGNRR
jgi:glycopeptide antibiotics resistance protein